MHERGIGLRPRALSDFVALVSAGDLAAAAGSLQTTPRALSRTVRELEHYSGEALLTSADRRLALTPAGEVMFRAAERVLAAVDRFEGVARVHRTTMRVAHVAGADTTSMLLEHMASQRREFSVEEHVVPDHRQVQALRDHRLDVAICTVAGALPDELGALLLRMDPLMVASRSPSAHAVPIDATHEQLAAPAYGPAWPAHDALIDGWASTMDCAVRRVAVPRDSGREVAAALRAARGTGVLAARSTLGHGVTAAPLAVRQPYLAWQLVWRRDDDSPQLDLMIAGAREVARRNRWLELLRGAGEPWLIGDA